MIKSDDCDDDVAAILGLEQGATGNGAFGRPVRWRRSIWICAALAAGLTAVRQSTAVDHSAERSAQIARDLAPARGRLRAEMLLAEPRSESEAIDASATHDALTVANQDQPVKIDANGSKREGRGLRSSELRRSVTLRRSQILARSLNLHPTTVLRLATHERTGQHTFLSDSVIEVPNDELSGGKNGAKVVQAERLEAIDAIRILRQR